MPTHCGAERQRRCARVGAPCPAAAPETEDQLGEICNVLVRAYRVRRDDLYFTLLCELCLPYLRGLALALQRRRPHASSDELLGKTLASLFRNLDQFEPHGPSALFRWLSVIAKNHARMAARSYNRRRRLEAQGAVREHDRSSDPAKCLEEQEQRTADEKRSRELAGLVRDCVKDLPVLTQRIWRLRMDQGLKYQDIAERLQVTEGLVAMRLKRAKDAIRRALGDQLTGTVYEPRPPQHHLDRTTEAGA